MKLHLPVSLFRAIAAALALFPVLSHAAYTKPTSITIPVGYTSQIVDSSDDITAYNGSSDAVAFLLTQDFYFSGTPTELSIGTDGARYFTSSSANQLVSLTFSDYNGRVFSGTDGSELTFSGTESVTFSENSASTSSDYSDAYGGAIYGRTITLSNNGSVTFSENSATASSSDFSDAYGGAIYGDDGSTITLSNNGSVTFSGNSASASSRACGGAIYGGVDSTITLSDNESVTFSGNSASGGGAIYGDEDSTIELSGNVSVTFSGNTASGGAIFGLEGSTIRLSDNESVTFSGNSASGAGGAIYGYGSTITLSGNESVEFSGNTASGYDSAGGAIYGASVSTITVSGNESVTFSGSESTITLSGNGSVTFSGNSAEGSIADGGAILGANSSIILTDNGSVTFSGNSAGSYGGAIAGTERLTYFGDAISSITITDNENVTFSGNSASYGGAIYSFRQLTLSCNGSVTFSGNSSGSSGWGGAIFGSTITLSGNGSVTFSENSIAASDVYTNVVYGGAIYGSTITLSDNGSVTFSENSIASDDRADSVYGGAIKGDTITLSDNESVTFSGNSARGIYGADGGAIYGADLCIANNDEVLFDGNVTYTKGGTYRLRGIDVSGETGEVIFSAPEGKSIEFRDSVYVSAGKTIKLNADYNGQKQSGDILFTGRYAENRLKTFMLSMKAGREATDSEIEASRTSELLGKAALYNGRLRVEDKAVLKGSDLTVKSGTGATVCMKDAALEFDRLTFEQGTGLQLQGINSITGNVYLENGSRLTLNPGEAGTEQPALTLTGSLVLGDTLYVTLNTDEMGLIDGERYALISGVKQVVGWETSDVRVNIENSWASAASLLSWENGTLWYTCDAPLYTWTNAAASRVWDTKALNWKEGNAKVRYETGMRVLFGNTGAGDILLSGTLTPKSVTVNNGAGYHYTWYGNGCLTGEMKLTKTGAGTLTINTVNYYTGGTAISGGTVVLGANNALGSGTVTLSNATLNMGGKMVANNLTLSGSSKILNGGNYRGNFTMNGNLLAGSAISIMSGKTANLKKGNVGGTISGAGNTVINGTVTLNGGKITTNKLTISGSGKKLTANASGLVMNKNASDIVLANSGNLTSAGAITARNITLSNKAVLNANNSAVRNITLGGKLQATDSTVNMFGNLSAANLVLTRSTLTNNGSSVRNLSLSGALTLSSATLNHYGNISAKNVTATASTIRQTGGPTGMKLSGNLSLGSKSTLNLFGTLNAANVTLSGNSVLNNANSTVRNAVVKGKLQATNSTVSLHGNLTAGNVVLNNATLRDNGSSARAVTVTNSTSLSNNAKLNIKGYLRSKNLTLNKSSLRQHSSNNGVVLTGTLTMNSGSTLTAQGALSAANMKLSGGTINLTSTSFSTIKVSGTLTLSSAIDLNLGCKLTTGRNYTLISFAKSNLTRSSNLTKLLGLTGSGATLTLSSRAITLKVTNAAAWNKYLSANKTAFNKAASVVNAIAPAAEEEEAVIAESSVTEPAYDRSSADMLVQSNWGVVNASRAFTDTLGNRTANRTVFGADKSSAVWLSAMGASSRLSSDGAAAGSDYNLFGAAVGMEQQLTEKSSLGLAIGESYGRVNSFTSARTKQDTLHTALYGQYSAVERSRDAVLLDWSAAYGRTESKWQGTEWEQKSVQLDARATWAHQLTADTTVSGFAGMQYFASESADIAPGIESGSVQNLRGEIGVGIGHMATVKTRVYGELSFVGDMVRHNPTAQTEGERERGANPGRAGINFSVGGTHALNDRWSVNANYNLELMERANSHSANVGTSYKF